MVTALNTWYLYLVSAFRREEGQDFTEYALILALIVLVGIAAIALSLVLDALLQRKRARMADMSDTMAPGKGAMVSN